MKSEHWLSIKKLDFSDPGGLRLFPADPVDLWPSAGEWAGTRGEKADTSQHDIGFLAMMNNQNALSWLQEQLSIKIF